MSGFSFVSGNIGLDLAGTVQHRRTDHTDVLSTPADLARWISLAGLLTTEPPISRADLAAARDLREAIYRLSTRAGSPADRELLNHVAETTPAEVRLAASGAVERTGTIHAALSTIARASIELLGSQDLARVKQCGGGECTRLFIDTSRASSRRWCDMLECGNRAKAAGFRARHRPA